MTNPSLPGKSPMKFVVAVARASLLLIAVTQKLPPPGLTTLPAILNLLTGIMLLTKIITTILIYNETSLLTILYILFFVVVVSISNHLVAIGDEGFFNRPGHQEYVP